MAEIKVELDIATEAADEDIKAWVSELAKSLPPDTRITVSRPPAVLPVTDLLEEHVGRQVRVNRDKTKVQIQGQLNAVYPHASSEYAKTVVVNGRAYEVGAFELVTLT